LSAVHDCLFNLFAATLHKGGRSSIRNLRTRHAVVTGTHYTVTVHTVCVFLCVLHCTHSLCIFMCAWLYTQSVYFLPIMATFCAQDLRIMLFGRSIFRAGLCTDSHTLSLGLYGRRDVFVHLRPNTIEFGRNGGHSGWLNVCELRENWPSEGSTAFLMNVSCITLERKPYEYFKLKNAVVKHVHCCTNWLLVILWNVFIMWRRIFVTTEQAAQVKMPVACVLSLCIQDSSAEQH